MKAVTLVATHVHHDLADDIDTEALGETIESEFQYEVRERGETTIAFTVYHCSSDPEGKQSIAVSSDPDTVDAPHTAEIEIRVRPSCGAVEASSPTLGAVPIEYTLRHIADICDIPMVTQYGTGYELRYGDAVGEFQPVVEALDTDRTRTAVLDTDVGAVTYQYNDTEFLVQENGFVKVLDESLDTHSSKVAALADHFNDRLEATETAG